MWRGYSGCCSFGEAWCCHAEIDVVAVWYSCGLLWILNLFLCAWSVFCDVGMISFCDGYWFFHGPFIVVVLTFHIMCPTDMSCILPEGICCFSHGYNIFAFESWIIHIACRHMLTMGSWGFGAWRLYCCGEEFIFCARILYMLGHMVCRGYIAYVDLGSLNICAFDMVYCGHESFLFGHGILSLVAVSNSYFGRGYYVYILCDGPFIFVCRGLRIVWPCEFNWVSWICCVQPWVIHIVAMDIVYVFAMSSLFCVCGMYMYFLWAVRIVSRGCYV